MALYIVLIAKVSTPCFQIPVWCRKHWFLKSERLPHYLSYVLAGDNSKYNLPRGQPSIIFWSSNLRTDFSYGRPFVHFTCQSGKCMGPEFDHRCACRYPRLWCLATSRIFVDCVVRYIFSSTSIIWLSIIFLTFVDRMILCYVVALGMLGNVAADLLDKSCHGQGPDLI